MPRIIGHLLLALGILHTLVALVIFAEPISQIVSTGVLNAVVPSPSPLTSILDHGFHETLNEVYGRLAAFWFLWTGFSWLVLGSLCFWLERALDRRIPAFVGWAFWSTRSWGLCCYQYRAFGS